MTYNGAQETAQAWDVPTALPIGAPELAQVWDKPIKRRESQHDFLCRLRDTAELAGRYDLAESYSADLARTEVESW